MGKTIYYTKEGKFSTDFREDVPHDKLHREDGPAVIYSYYGRKGWYINGKCHRENGPAITDDNTLALWVLNNKIIWNVREWCEENDIDQFNMSNEDVMAFKLRFL